MEQSVQKLGEVWTQKFSISPSGAVRSDDSLNMQSFTLLFSVNNFLMHREDSSKMKHGKLASITLTLLDDRGGGIRPPYHIFVIPRKKLKGKIAHFFYFS